MVFGLQLEEEGMRLEDYFDFINEKAIRLKGTRVGIETVLRDYQRGAGPEEIVLHYPTLTLEQVYATITYYLANQAKLDEYLALVTRRQEEAWKEQQQPSEFVRALRERLERKKQLLYEEESSAPLIVR
jgi:uncharacterized protein (DUF433 family)